MRPLQIPRHTVLAIAVALAIVLVAIGAAMAQLDRAARDNELGANTGAAPDRAVSSNESSDLATTNDLTSLEPQARRPAVIALFESTVPYAAHSEFNLSAADKNETMLALGLSWPNETRALHEGPATFPVNHFVAYEESTILGVFNADLEAFFGDNESLEPSDHATATAGMAVGQTLGACPSCVVVRVRGETAPALAWIYHQPWIDAASISSATIPMVGMVEAIERIRDSGRPVFVAAGNDPSYSEILRGYRDAPGIVVGMATPHENYFVTQGLRPDVVTYGDSITVPTADGGEEMSAGTSLSAPQLAGRWGRLLMTGWESDWFERSVSGKTVRNVLTSDCSPSYLDDGALDADDVLPTLSRFADPDMRLWTPTHAVTPPGDPSLWFGVGGMFDDETANMQRSFCDDWEYPVRPYGPAHAANLEARAIAAETWKLSNRHVTCGQDHPECWQTYYLNHDHWFTW